MQTVRQVNVRFTDGRKAKYINVVEVATQGGTFVISFTQPNKVEFLPIMNVQKLHMITEDDNDE